MLHLRIIGTITAVQTANSAPTMPPLQQLVARTAADLQIASRAPGRERK